MYRYTDDTIQSPPNKADESSSPMPSYPAAAALSDEATIQRKNRFLLYKKVMLIVSVVIACITVTVSIIERFSGPEDTAFIELIIHYRPQLLIFSLGNAILSIALFLKDTIRYEYNKARKADCIAGIIIAALLLIVQYFRDGSFIHSIYVTEAGALLGFAASVIIYIACIVCIIVFACRLSDISRK